MAKITLNHITKVEGHARLDLEIEEGKLIKCELGSVEGSRYFEGIMKGRKWNEPQEIATRICGICSSAHDVAAITAMENCLGVKPSKQTVNLRILQTIGERIRSHAAHLYFLSLPDYLGYDSAIAMASKYKEEVQRALRIMKLGNDILTAVTGRTMHPVSGTIGGWLHYPTQETLNDLRNRLEKMHDDILETCKLFATLDYPDFTNKTQYICLIDKGFGTISGEILIEGKTYAQKDLHDFLLEYHEPFSSANFVVRENKAYAAGALARINNNGNKLSKETKEFMKKIKIKFPSYNPFNNNLAQALELMHYRECSIELLDNLKIQKENLAPVVVKEGHGIAAVEAPRGILWHEYKTDQNGVITYANIITPTAQFLRNLNEDIAKYVQQLLDKGADEPKITFEIEKLIRSYDPCFSCSSHFLKINWKKK